MGKLRAPEIGLSIGIYVNGSMYGISVQHLSDTFESAKDRNPSFYSISNNKVVWSDGTILQYNGTDVLPADTFVEGGTYTTRANTPSGGETWVLNETLSLTNEDKQFDVTFTSNENVSYIGIHRAYFPKLGLNNLSFVKQSSAGSATNDVVVYYVDGNEWVSEAYRTVTFDNPPTGDLLTWLQANATKQDSTPSTSQVSIDLTTLSGWGNVADGQHSIQVVAKADGYESSEYSQAVKISKGNKLYSKNGKLISYKGKMIK